jgi:hypothetical protein
MATISFRPGDGTEIMVEVAYLGQGPKDARGRGAFCHGDPCAENGDPTTEIARYIARNPRAETCPMCEGRPS